ncbi:MAG TPA: hypothetical protein VF936_15430 [Burkholderiales bacterium]
MRNAMLVVFISLTACTSVEPGAPQIKDDNDYVTGSNLPRRSRSSDVRVLTKDQVDDLMRSRPGPMPAGGM